MTTTTTTTTTTIQNVTVVPDWALFPPEVGLWSYELGVENSPEHWGMIKNKTTGQVLYPLCADKPTSTQSPIDITTSFTTKIEGSVTPVRSYGSSAFKLKPRPGGHPGFQVLAADTTPDAKWVVDGVNCESSQSAT